MAVIEARRLERWFRVAVKSPGLAGAMKHLVRPRYREVVALRPLDLRVAEGESVGYVGPNGAGKSTTLKLFSGILTPTAGEVRVCGLLPHRDRIAHARNIGVVFGQRAQLWWDLPVRDSLRLLGDMYAVPAQVFARNFDELVASFELEPLLATPVRQLSLGQRMRCDLAAALLHAPSVLFLDEPTLGLDIEVKQRVRAVLADRHRRGATIVLTSHDLGDVEQLCDRLVLIAGGAVVFDGPLSRIRAEYGGRRALRLMLKAPIDGLVARLDDALAALPADVEQAAGSEVVIGFDTARVTAGELAAALLPALPVHDLRLEEPTIESILLRMYRGEATRDASAR